MLAPIVAALVGIGATAGPSEAMPTHLSPKFSPYETTAANFMYNLLFCDDRDSFRAQPSTTPAEWQHLLFAQPADVRRLQQVAGDESASDGRVRYLAFTRLREEGERVTPKVLLGVIVEVGLNEGLDTLAAYSDGGVRYINRSGKMSVVEGVKEIRPLVGRLFAASELVVARIGPSEEPRRPPPGKGRLRLTFLVSDGLYIGEGPLQGMERDALAGPVFREASQLLTWVVGVAVPKAK